MVCKICGHGSDPLFSKKVLGKYNVGYFQCSFCEFVQTEEPYWLDEAYQNVITTLDIGLITRNLYIAPIVKSIVYRNFNADRRFLDYGGGYGLLVRMMRDQGLDFYRQDKYCDNLFSKNFDVADVPDHGEFEMLTAFEVFEHLTDPVAEVVQMQHLSKSILFSTELIPSREKLGNWEYLTPETGQHIALYSYKSLQELAKKFGLQLYSNGKTLHLFTPKKLSSFWFKWLAKNKISLLYNSFLAPKRTLLQTDYQAIKNSLNRVE